MGAKNSFFSLQEDVQGSQGPPGSDSTVDISHQTATTTSTEEAPLVFKLCNEPDFRPIDDVRSSDEDYIKDVLKLLGERKLYIYIHF